MKQTVKQAMKQTTVLGFLAIAGITAAAGQPGPASLFAYHQRPGSIVPGQLALRDADGSETRLGDLAQGMPLILIPAYFHCANLCGVVRASLFLALGPTGLEAGRDYALAVLSIDPTETSADARQAKSADLAAFALPGGAQWHYLTGNRQSVQAVVDAVGFRDRFDQRTRQFIHPAGIVFLTPRGAVSSYLLGVGYTPTQVRAAIARAGAGGVAAASSPLLLLCFHFDAATGRYSLEIMKVVRLAGFLSVITLAGVLFLLFRRERRQA